ncbi:MAG: hypothetical protein K2X87_24270, partial [Gemmataceae bacterium]|nr:hypothetical protein [Gemmataceae bacterium]
MISKELQPVSGAAPAAVPPAAGLLDAVRAVWDEGHRQLARYAAPDEVTAARDRVAAMEDVVRRAVRDRADRLYAQNLLAALRLRQERWLGRWLAAHVNHAGGGDRRSRGRDGTAARDLPAGVTKNQSATFQKLAAVPDAAFDRYLSDAHD